LEKPSFKKGGRKKEEWGEKTGKSNEGQAQRLGKGGEGTGSRLAESTASLERKEDYEGEGDA